MKPIQYKFQPEFEPVKDSNYGYIYNKRIIAEPFEWNNGYGISFIIEVEIPLEGKIIGSRTKTLERYDYFDRDVRKNKDNYNLSLLFAPLYKGEIRGDYAEKVIWDIFYN
jgi:hypothetical protein